MNPLDIFLIALIIVLFFKSFTQGFISTVGQLIGIFLGWILASNFYDLLASLLKPLFLGNINIASIFSFIVLFFGIIELCGWLISFLNLITKLPFLATFNSFLGGLFGFFLANLSLGLLMYFLTTIPVPIWLENLIQTSPIATGLIQFAKATLGFLPSFLS